MSHERPGGLSRRDFLKALGIGVTGALADTPSSIFKSEGSSKDTESVNIAERIRAWIALDSEKYTVRRELRDERGLYVLELELAGEKPGETIEYSYQRKGSWRESGSLTTRIDVTYFQDGDPISGERIATFNEATGEWEKGQ